jgi:6-phosphogluconolactonase (cycloisomerase 2 family)
VEIAAIPDEDTTTQVSTFCGDIGSLKYDGIFKDVSAQTDKPWDLAVDPDSSVLFLLSKADKSLYQYSFSELNDVSSLSYDSVSFDVSSQSDAPHGVYLTPSGTRLYISDDAELSSTDGVYQYNLDSWDLDSIAYSSKFLSTPIGFNGFFDVVFSSDGKKLFALMHNGSSVGKIVKEYELSTSWELDTASLTGIEFDASAQASDFHSLDISSDGTRFYLISRFGNVLFQYDLSEENELNSISYSGEFFEFSDQASDSHGFAFSNNGNTFFVVDDTTDSIYQYSLFCNLVQSNGFLEIRVNGVTEISKSDAKTTFTDNKEYSSIALAFGTSKTHGVITDIDDWFIWDDSGAWNNSFLGDRRSFILNPNQDTNIADFEPSSGSFGYKMIDEGSPDDDSTFILANSDLLSGSPLSGTSEFHIEDIVAGVSSISALNVITRSAKTDDTSAELFTSINSGSNSVSSAAHTLATSYQYYSDVYEYDPATIANLTRDGVNSLSVSVTAEDLDSGEESPGEEIAVPWGSRAVFGGGITTDTT